MTKIEDPVIDRVCGPYQRALIDAANRAGQPHEVSCGGIVLHANGYLLVPEPTDDSLTMGVRALLVYDNNGRYVRAQACDVMPAGDALTDAVRQVATLERVHPQVRIAFR